MTKKEFLKQLKAALDNYMSLAAIAENLDYYGSYIDGEIQGGKKESEVVASLGDPWAIARTIIETEKRNGGGEYTYSVQEDQTSRSYRDDNTKMKMTIKQILTIVLIIVIILAVIGTVMGLIVSLLPIIIPVVAVLFIIRLFQNKP